MKTQKQRDIARIKLGQKSLGLDDTTYRAMLWTNCRVESCTQLDHQGRAKIISLMQQKGAYKKQPKKSGTRNNLSMITALQTQFNLSDNYINAIAKQMHKRDHIKFCSPTQQRAVFVAVEKAQRKIILKKLMAHLNTNLSHSLAIAKETAIQQSIIQPTHNWLGAIALNRVLTHLKSEQNHV